MTSFKTTPAQREMLDEAAAQAGLTRSDYIKARLFGNPTRDRSLYKLIAALHVAGLGLTRLTSRGELLRVAQRAELDQLLRDVRSFIDQLAARFA